MKGNGTSHQHRSILMMRRNNALGKTQKYLRFHECKVDSFNSGELLEISHELGIQKYLTS